MEQTYEKQYIEHAGFGSRFGAYIIDFILAIILAICCSKIVSAVCGDANSDWVKFFVGNTTYTGNSVNTDYSNCVALFMLLTGIIEAITGAGIGKRIVGISIKNTIGDKPTQGVLIARWALKYLGTILFLISLFTDSWLILAISKTATVIIMLSTLLILTEYKQAIYDIIVKTMVYKNKKIILYETTPLN